MRKNNLSQLKNGINKIQWYKQAAEVKSWYIGFPYWACFNFTIFGKPVPLHFRGLIGYFGPDNYFEVYFPRLTMRRVADYYLSRQMRNRRFVKVLKTRWDRKTKILRQLIDELLKADLKYHSSKQLLSQYKRLSKAYLTVWRESIFIDAYDVEARRVLDDALAKANKKLSEPVIDQLTRPIKMSWLNYELRDRVKLAEKISGHRELVKQLKKCKTFAALKNARSKLVELINKHHQRYHWLQNDLAGSHPISRQYFLDEIGELLDRKKFVEAKKSLAKYSKNKKIARALIRKYQLPGEVSRTINYLVALAHWRDDRKAHLQMANGLLSRFSREFSRRTRKPLAKVERYFWWEVKNIFTEDEELDQLLLDRSRGYFFIKKPYQKAPGLVGRPAKQLNKFLISLITGSAKANSMTGLMAYAGKAAGRSNVILSRKDFNKMKPGDILVASNTRPEYVPVMKKASAIITEEGGMTSHPAIVSRELKIPCIVGVQGAVNRLRTGTRLKIDAAKGEITIVKNKK
ncbi:MAG: PEP-utilizing enzyme [Patescibacteria group bacterium]